MDNRAAAGAVQDVVVNPGMQGPGAERAERDVLAASTMAMAQVQDVGAMRAGLAADSRALEAMRTLPSFSLGSSDVLQAMNETQEVVARGDDGVWRVMSAKDPEGRVIAPPTLSENGSYTYSLDGNTITQYSNGGRRIVTAGGDNDYMHFGEDGKLQMFFHANGGRTESFERQGDHWIRRSGGFDTSGMGDWDRDEMQVANLEVNPDGSYKFDTPELNRQTEVAASGARIDRDTLSDGKERAFVWDQSGNLVSINFKDSQLEQTITHTESGWQVSFGNQRIAITDLNVGPDGTVSYREPITNVVYHYSRDGKLTYPNGQ